MCSEPFYMYIIYNSVRRRHWKSTRWSGCTTGQRATITFVLIAAGICTVASLLNCDVCYGSTLASSTRSPLVDSLEMKDRAPCPHH